MTKSFTLIEILVVIVIIGIISGFIIVSMAGVSSKANIAKGQAFSSSLKNSLLMNLVSEYKFEGSTPADSPAVIGDAADSWGSNNANSVAGNPLVKEGSSCVSGKCISFDGVGDVITFSNPANFDLDYITVDVWFKINSFADSGARWIISKPGLWGTIREGWLFAITNATQKMTFWGQATGGALDTTFNTVYGSGLWYNFTYTYNGDYEKAYVNGALDASINTSDGTIVPCSEASEPLYISSASVAFNGLIDNVHIYNAAIPSSQIQQNYYSGLNRLLANSGMGKQEYGLRINELMAQN
jgi:prepilin-type N-terminal cleavage/methylation domain-containing protein